MQKLLWEISEDISQESLSLAFILSEYVNDHWTGCEGRVKSSSSMQTRQLT